MSDLLDWLFRTEALQVAPADRPFWYTSGTIGPYYINTHYLYGGREKAGRLLDAIDRVKDRPLECPGALLAEVRRTYAEDSIYQGVMDRIAETAREKANLNEIGYVSGGERRDWLFSVMAGVLMDKPLLLIFKDKTMVSADLDGQTARVEGLSGARVLHVADLITEASSYLRAWIPAIEASGGRMTHAINVVDRDQGGREALQAKGVEPQTLIKIDASLFETMRTRGMIDQGQLRSLLSYRADPRAAMREFLLKHPDFHAEALASEDERVASRARLMAESDPYGIVAAG